MMTLQLVKKLSDILTAKKLKMVTAESCTGGGLGYHLTDLPGSSDWFERGFITYSNASKIDMLGVTAETLSVHGAVSEETAREMAEGALAQSEADVAVAVTGVAGPSGGSLEKPVGTVWVAVATKLETKVCAFLFAGGRAEIRTASIQAAIESAITLIEH